MRRNYKSPKRYYCILIRKWNFYTCKRWLQFHLCVNSVFWLRARKFKALFRLYTFKYVQRAYEALCIPIKSLYCPDSNEILFWKICKLACIYSSFYDQVPRTTQSHLRMRSQKTPFKNICPFYCWLQYRVVKKCVYFCQQEQQSLG